MAMSRHEIREQIFRLLFSAASHEDEDVREWILRYLDDTLETKLTDFERAEILSKTTDLVDKIPELDAKIDSVSEGWRVGRMGRADLSVLRLGLYEMLYDDKVPVKVAINEAVDIAKEYCSEDTPAFVNGILAKFVGE